MNNSLIDVLIPTFNRSSDLIKNIKSISAQVTKLQDRRIRVIVSNNASTDETYNVLENLDKKSLPFQVEIFNQERNIGLEPNAVFLLQKSRSKYSMFLGDDDFLPDGYLDFVISKIETEENVGCIIPGFSALYKDGSTKPLRTEPFDIRKFKKGFGSLLKISHFGHQLSGLLIRRNGVVEEYLRFEENRNIYPFIFFASYCIKNYESYYAPRFQVMVSQDNSKDWRYDESGLILDILKNYKSLYPQNRLKQLLLSLTFSNKQNWRLRVGKNIENAVSAFFHIINSRDADAIYKTFLPFVYFYCYFQKFAKYLIKKRG